MAQDVLITPASGKIEFKNNTTVSASLVLDAATSDFDITGKVVKHLDLGSMGMGRHELNINADGLRNGIYYYSIFNEEFKITKKMVLQK